MAHLAIVTYLALAVAGVFSVALPPAGSPPFYLPPDYIKPFNATDITSPNSHPAPSLDAPTLAARFVGANNKDYTDQPDPKTVPKVMPRPHKFSAAKIARCIFTLDTGPCCGPLSVPRPRSDECKEKWGDPDYSRQKELDFCRAQTAPPQQCGVFDEDTYNDQVMVWPEEGQYNDDQMR